MLKMKGGHSRRPASGAMKVNEIASYLYDLKLRCAPLPVKVYVSQDFDPTLTDRHHDRLMLA